MILKKIYTKQYWLFLAIGFLPLMYKILQIMLVSSYNNAIKIIGQFAFIEIIFKVFQETLITPLFKVLGNNDNNVNTRNYFAKKLLLLYSILCIVFTIFISLLLDPIMNVSSIPAEIYADTKTFLQIVIFASGINIIVQYLFTFNIISDNSKNIFVYFLISSIFTFILDIVLVPKWALGLGVSGIATTMLIVSMCQLLYLVFSMPRIDTTNIAPFNKSYYFTLCGISLLESLIRNLTYYFVILVLINTLNNQDLYYLSNEYIWSIMLIPTLAQNNCIKQSVSQDNNITLTTYFVHNIIITIYIAAMVPIGYVLYRYIFNLANYMDYFVTLIKLTPCYIIFIFDNVIESYFVTTGQMHHVFVQTFITNIVVYLTSYILYLTGVWTITLNSIILIFSAGVILSSAYTIAVYVYQQYKNNYTYNIKYK